MTLIKVFKNVDSAAKQSPYRPRRIAITPWRPLRLPKIAPVWVDDSLQPYVHPSMSDTKRLECIRRMVLLGWDIRAPSHNLPAPVGGTRLGLQHGILWLLHSRDFGTGGRRMKWDCHVSSVLVQEILTAADMNIMRQVLIVTTWRSCRHRHLQIMVLAHGRSRPGPHLAQLIWYHVRLRRILPFGLFKKRGMCVRCSISCGRITIAANCDT